jgi:hypothetical protein
MELGSMNGKRVPASPVDRFLLERGSRHQAMKEILRKAEERENRRRELPVVRSEKVAK